LFVLFMFLLHLLLALLPISFRVILISFLFPIFVVQLATKVKWMNLFEFKINFYFLFIFYSCLFIFYSCLFVYFLFMFVYCFQKKQNIPLKIFLSIKSCL